MKYVVRLFWLVITQRRRTRCSIVGPCTSSFRVLPNDLDVFMHMNNGVYLTMADLGRTDLMLRSDTFHPIRQRGWYPVMTGGSIRFRRSLQLGQRYTIVTRILGWDERSLYIEQRFERVGERVAELLLEGRFLARAGGRVAIAEVLALAGHDTPSPALPPHVSDWVAALHAPREGQRAD